MLSFRSSEWYGPLPRLLSNCALYIYNFILFFLSATKLYMLQTPQNIDLLLESVYLWCLIKWMGEWMKLSDHCLKVVFHLCLTSHILIINTSPLGSVFSSKKIWCLKFSNSRCLLTYKLLDITSPIFHSTW